MRFVSVMTVSLMFAVPAFADDDRRACSPEQRARMDAQFGAGSADMTTCLQVRKDVKAVIALNNALLHKKGFSQQVNNIKNYANDAEEHGMVLNADFAVTAIGYGAGGRWLLTDDAYNRQFATSTGNPSRALVESLLARGVGFSMCQNTMKANLWTKADLLPGVNMVPAGVGALVDMQKQGWTYISP